MVTRRLAAVIRRAAAIPAAPAPTITTSTSPDERKAASAGDATELAAAAMNERRLKVGMVGPNSEQRPRCAPPTCEPHLAPAECATQTSPPVNQTATS
jgi:hypothetical protein